MAADVTRKELLEMEETPYEDVRPKLKDGDLFFCSGEYFVSRAIRRFSESPWSHVGLILRIRELDRVLLLESVEDAGVRFAPLSKYLDDYEKGRPYRGALVVARFEGLAADKIQPLAQFGTDALTRPYDKDEIAKIVVRIALRLGRKERDREYICSELVYECFAHAGYEFAYDPKGFISPQDVWQDPRVRFLYRLANPGRSG